MLFFDRELGRQRVTLSTADVWLSHRTMHFLTVGRDLNSPLKKSRERMRYSSVQLEKFAGVRLQDAGDRTGLAKIARPFLPGGFQQATLFEVPAPKVVTVEVFTFFSSRSTHIFHRNELGSTRRNAVVHSDPLVRSIRTNSMPQSYDWRQLIPWSHNRRCEYRREWYRRP
jgi:hypothetical protein